EGAAKIPGFPSLQYLGSCLHAFQLNKYQSNCGGSDTRYARSLTDCRGPGLLELVTRFHGQARNTVIVEAFRDGKVFLGALTLHILELLLNITRILHLNFDLFRDLGVFDPWPEQEATTRSGRLHESRIAYSWALQQVICRRFFFQCLA